MCPCVTDVGVPVTNLRVMCKIITCVSAFRFTDLVMAIIIILLIFLEIVKTAAKLLLQVWTLCVAGYSKDAIVGAYHRTSDGQEHKIIRRAGLERDMIFHLRVTACREQGRHCHDQGTSCSSSFVSKVVGANWRRANNFHRVADKFAIVH